MATRVLLIEDEPLLVSLYAAVLSQGGYEVLTAPTAESGEEKVIVIRPHVVLLDLLIPRRPGENIIGESLHEPVGYQVLRLIKNTPGLRDIRVIVLSNLDSDEHVRTAKNLGADEYLVKANIDPHELKSHVERILHQPGDGKLVRMG
ncbi:MAG: response regulator [Candidatus Kerfeldbacteria bacterium]|nr:response regulator [Candidatus Kerfeldbacteria bacterium]